MGIIPRRRRRGYRAPRDLRGYREDLTTRTGQIDTELGAMVDLLDALRRRDADASDALTRLHAAEGSLRTAADVLREIVAPEELHRLHTEYEGNLARALRGIMTAERGCALTRLPRDRRLCPRADDGSPPGLLHLRQPNQGSTGSRP